jgi:nucleoid DNA-binding protein
MAPSTPKPTAAKPARPARTPKTDKPVRAASPVKAAAKAVPAASKRSAAKPAAKSESGGDTIKLRDLIDTVAAATGAKKPEAKKAVEAVLAAIGAGLASRSMLVLPPLGKLRVAKANAGVLTLKLRMADATRAKGLALADGDEDG